MVWMLFAVTIPLLLIMASSSDPLPARECAEVFGDQRAVRTNRRAREARLNFVIDLDTHVVVDHSYVWSEPKETEIRNLALVETSTDGSTALVFFAAGEEGIECADGFYRIAVDDSLGPDGQILAVLRRGLLIELDGRLIHLSFDGDASPEFRVAWSSRFGIRRRTTRSKPSPVRRRN
jgi:hypothetical protein